MDVNNQNASPFDCADWFLKQMLSAQDSEAGLQDGDSAMVYHIMAQAAPEDVSLVNVQLAKLEESVDDSFLDDDRERVFIEHIRGVRTALKSVTNSLEDETDFRANGEQRLLAYLDRYMELLYQTLANWEILQQTLDARKFCRLIVNLGCVFLGAQYSCAGNMTPFAPPYVAALLETSRQLIRFQNATETLPDGDICEQIVTIKWETLCLRLLRYMRWFTVSPENELAPYRIERRLAPGYRPAAT